MQGFEVVAVDPDQDYLGIEIRASSGRFAGSTRIYAGLHELSEFATEVQGFPKSPDDQRKHEFGSPEPQTAEGYCRVVFRL